MRNSIQKGYPSGIPFLFTEHEEEYKMKRTKRLDRILKYEAHRVKVYEDVLEFPDGQIRHYDYVKNRDGAAILLVDEEERALLVRQYRNVEDDFTLEIPAGVTDPEDATPEVTAIREAKEETGFYPTKVFRVGRVLNAAGLFDEHTTIFLGKDLKQEKLDADPEETIEVVRIPVEEAVSMIYDGRIIDGKTIIALLAWVDVNRDLNKGGKMDAKKQKNF